jgi:hypothetical protein
MARPPVVNRNQLAAQLQFNPHIWWDPVPPWVNLKAELQQELTKIRLEHQKEVLDLQSKALDKALTAIKGQR